VVLSFAANMHVPFSTKEARVLSTKHRQFNVAKIERNYNSPVVAITYKKGLTLVMKSSQISAGRFNNSGKEE
jgi:hypothetical protein